MMYATKNPKFLHRSCHDVFSIERYWSPVLNRQYLQLFVAVGLRILPFIILTNAPVYSPHVWPSGGAKVLISSRVHTMSTSWRAVLSRPDTSHVKGER